MKDNNNRNQYQVYKRSELRQRISLSRMFRQIKLRIGSPNNEDGDLVLVYVFASGFMASLS